MTHKITTNTLPDDYEVDSEVLDERKEIVEYYIMGRKLLPDMSRELAKIILGSEKYKKIQQEIGTNIDTYEQDLALHNGLGEDIVHGEKRLADRKKANQHLENPESYEALETDIQLTKLQQLRLAKKLHIATNDVFVPLTLAKLGVPDTVTLFCLDATRAGFTGTKEAMEAIIKKQVTYSFPETGGGYIVHLPGNIQLPMPLDETRADSTYDYDYFGGKKTTNKEYTLAYLKSDAGKKYLAELAASGKVLLKRTELIRILETIAPGAEEDIQIGALMGVTGFHGWLGLENDVEGGIYLVGCTSHNGKRMTPEGIREVSAGIKECSLTLVQHAAPDGKM